MASEVSEPNGSVGTRLKIHSQGLIDSLGRAHVNLARFPWWAVIVAIIGLYIGLGILASPRYREVLRFIAPGLRVTLQATFAAYGLALIIGLVFGLMRVSRNPVLYAVSTLYVEIVRGIPMLVLDHVGFIRYSFLHNTLMEGKSHAQTQEVQGGADR